MCRDCMEEFLTTAFVLAANFVKNLVKKHAVKTLQSTTTFQTLV